MQIKLQHFIKIRVPLFPRGMKSTFFRRYATNLEENAKKPLLPNIRFFPSLTSIESFLRN